MNPTVNEITKSIIGKFSLYESNTEELQQLTSQYPLFADLMADYAVLARDAGARIIGGCCGTMPDHLRAMRKALETRAKGDVPTLDAISNALGGFSSASDGTGDTSGDPKRERRGRRG